MFNNPSMMQRGIASEKSECGSIVVNAGGGGYTSVEQTYDETNPNRNWRPKYGKLSTDPFPLFNYDAVLNQELDELIRRERSRIGKGGGEGIDPNLYEKEVERVQKQMAPLACAWYSCMDVATWHRTNETRKFAPGLVPDNWAIKKGTKSGIRIPS